MHVISPSSLLSSSPLPCSWLSFCRHFVYLLLWLSFRLSTGPAHLHFASLIILSKMSLTLVLLLITEFLTLSCCSILHFLTYHAHRTQEPARLIIHRSSWKSTGFPILTLWISQKSTGPPDLHITKLAGPPGIITCRDRQTGRKINPWIRNIFLSISCCAVTSFCSRNFITFHVSQP